MRATTFDALRARVRTLAGGRLGDAVTIALFFVGATLGLSFLQSALSWGYVIAAAAIMTAARVAMRARASKRLALRLLGIASSLQVGAFHLLLVYFALTWGTSLAWATPRWLRMLVAVLGLACALGWRWRRSPRGLHVPIALPLGIWIASCLAGWLREESFARCDDYLAVTAQPGIELVVATTPDVARCTPGRTLPIGRYARRTWESPDGKRYVVTTQSGISERTSDAVPGAFDGLVCEVAADGSSPPRCLGGTRGKSHGIADAESIDELFVAAWSVRRTHGSDSVVLRLPRDRPIEILEEHGFKGNVAELYYQPTQKALGLFTDECDAVRVVSATDFHALPSPGTNGCPTELRYDPKRDVGMWCGGQAGIGAVFHGDPFSYRPLARDGLSLGWIGLSWGCDWDPSAGKAYSTVPNLGLLATIDLESGRVERSRFVGFSMRSVAFDGARKRVYLTDFLRGDVVAIGLESGREVARWFAGRFVREVRLTRDGRALLTASNLGLWRIRLDAD